MNVPYWPLCCTVWGHYSDRSSAGWPYQTSSVCDSSGTVTDWRMSRWPDRTHPPAPPLVATPVLDNTCSITTWMWLVGDVADATRTPSDNQWSVSSMHGDSGGRTSSARHAVSRTVPNLLPPLQPATPGLDRTCCTAVWGRSAYCDKSGPRNRDGDRRSPSSTPHGISNPEVSSRRTRTEIFQASLHRSPWSATVETDNTCSKATPRRYGDRSSTATRTPGGSGTSAARNLRGFLGWTACSMLLATVGNDATTAGCCSERRNIDPCHQTTSIQTNVGNQRSSRWRSLLVACCSSTCSGIQRDRRWSISELSPGEVSVSRAGRLDHQKPWSAEYWAPAWLVSSGTAHCLRERENVHTNILRYAACCQFDMFDIVILVHIMSDGHDGWSHVSHAITQIPGVSRTSTQSQWCL